MLLGYTLSTHWPHDEVDVDTRVPVVALLVPFMPVIVTCDPVTALTPPPDAQAVPVEPPPALVAVAVMASPSQLPCDPDAVLL